MNKMTFIVCEQVREEKKGSASLIGVMPTNGEIIAREIPFIIPTLSVFICYSVEKQSALLNIAVTEPGGEIAARVRNKEIKVRNPNGRNYYYTTLSPLLISKRGEYRISVTLEDQEEEISIVVASVEDNDG